MTKKNAMILIESLNAHIEKSLEKISDVAAYLVDFRNSQEPARTRKTASLKHTKH